MTPKDVDRMLRLAGWQELPGRAKGSHRVYQHPDRPGDRITLPWHGKDLAPGTLNAILKHAGLR
ncbi:MAG: type II toxin-antitoxin system HicA family toxin [Candidatus Lambdaproteobacteria bacterium]|nr:type II toxin-antitoxin system HicA family toxin [Candidatus Lambdaproteobacteria bacterium]